MYNTHVVVDCNGSIISKYSKAHLFDVDIKGKVSLKESDYFMPGSAIVPPVETPVGKIGLGIVKIQYRYLSTRGGSSDCF